MKLSHPLILADLNEGKVRVHCPIPEQLTEPELKVVKTLIAETVKNPQIFSGHTPGRYEVKFTKINAITRKFHVELTQI